jgi:hypothetical protein
VGGLADYVSNSGKVKNSYSASPVTASGTKGGLIAGNSSGIVENSFWDIDSSGQPTSAGGTGLSTEQMKTFLTYSNAGWDFNNVWHICEITNYPRLLWQVPLADMLCPYGVDFIDYSFLASRWLWSDRGDCGGLELTGDGIVNSAELAILANYWQQTACGDCAGIDYSGDGNVDSSDLVILCDNWLIADYGDIDGAELTGDGLVDLEDLYAFVENWLDGL